jgi:hypothetical protein
MSDEILFTIRLTEEDWETHFRAWRCPALGIPGAFVKEAFGPEGHPLATTFLRVDKGPARVTWIGPAEPSQLALVVGLGEQLSPASEGAYWKRFAIVVPIVAALIGALATYISKPSADPRTLQLRVDPLEMDASGLPPPKVTINSQEVKLPINYKVTADVIAIVDVSKAFNYAKTLTDASDTSVRTLNALTKEINDFTSRVSGNICGGGSNGIASPLSGSLAAQGTSISGKVKNVASDLAVAQASVRK